MVAHVKKVCNFFFAHYVRVYSGISGFLPLLKRKREKKSFGRLGKLWYFSNAKLGTCCGGVLLLRWKRAWPSTTNLYIYTVAVSDSQPSGLSVTDVWEDGHGTT